MKPEFFGPELALELVKPECEESKERTTHEDFWLWNTDPEHVPARKDLPS